MLTKLTNDIPQIFYSGPTATYLARGDRHDQAYDSMGVKRSFFNLNSYSTAQSKYSGVPISKEYCTFNINVYPSKDMEMKYLTANPIIFASAAILIFVFTSIVFMIYDCKVERRQKLVMSTAVQSRAVVSSLFPSNIRDKILQDSDEETKTPATSNSSSRKGNMRTYLSRNSIQNNTINVISNSKHADESSIMIKLTSRPIADLFPETTVFFADISGFTAWSSARGPYQVFTLQETWYSEFDKIARMRRVFKVETIGDSYVAVAGLPDPMKNHAVVMAKFAEDILHVMKRVMNALSSTLGPDTADLNVRVGLNSGPTTAGVIRGDKSRFQLFGDTVNTTSRMESMGIPGRIHCSQKTADLLIQSGKGHWLTK
jgi:class 3 adenylate cyclase